MTDILRSLEAERKRKRVVSTLSVVILCCIVAAGIFVGGVFVFNNYLSGYFYSRFDSVFGFRGISESSHFVTEEWMPPHAQVPSGFEVPAYVQLEQQLPCGNGAQVLISFPGGLVLNLTGEDAGVRYDVQAAAGYTLAGVPGGGFVADEDLMRVVIGGFVSAFNYDFERATARVYDDRIEITKGVGQVSVCEDSVFGMAYAGLFKSLDLGQPVEKEYVLPYAPADVAMLAGLREGIRAYAISAEFDPETGGISDCATGVDFDFIEAVTLLRAASSGDVVTIDFTLTEPEVSREYLESVLFRDLIGETITHIAGTANRLNNIVLSSAAVDGYILMPGDVFSFNQTVGRRTYERGYRPAPAFISGQTVNVTGGGICQVSSSIFNAIMDSDIQIVERRPHGRPVAYLPRGRDATVSWGTIDFRFANNTQFPLRIDAQVEQRTLIVRVFGTMCVNGAEL